MAGTLYARLSGYDGIAAVSDNLVSRLIGDAKLGRYWAHRGTDGLRREKQLLIDFLCAVSGGPMVHVGRDMKTAHQGMKVDEADWGALIGHLEATLGEFKVPAAERAEVLGTTKVEIVE